MILDILNYKLNNVSHPNGLEFDFAVWTKIDFESDSKIYMDYFL